VSEANSQVITVTPDGLRAILRDVLVDLGLIESRAKEGIRPKRSQSVEAALDPDALLEMEVVETLTGRRRSTIYDLIKQGAFPAGIVCGAKCTRWRAGDVRTWLRAQAQQRPQ
jgi:prophage regulatory protein